ncbi:sulfatase [Microbacterium rhizosphaerae]|uniref:Sulfatase n=1 Tax=Microbacterium rhizosphaerae TaxID=1678237 RepID=A0ABZ0SLL4_9MICO|nr:sulfatase [Microbacterium rhizosphaerae]WPR89075.1 sulfatase [Microbacterium rhizosphaerae]
MRAIILMFDSLNRHMLSPYAETFVDAPNFARLASRATTFDNFYAGSMPCMPARRELHTGRYNFLHRSWGPLEPFDDSMPEILGRQGIHTHLVSDHPHYWEDGGATYHTRYTTWEFFRGQEGDPWKGVVSNEVAQPGFAGFKKRLVRQDAVNRSYMATEDQHSQTRTVDAGLEFIRTNAAADRWMLQLELFDPHEPFFTHAKYKDLYPHEYDGPEFDWPGYQKVSEPDAQVEHARREYAALVSMCDASLGRVLDAMDEHDLWNDTLLIVNTDHGFLLGEHGWWAKSVQPWFNELVHLPMFLWDPRTRGRDDRRGALAQTIDIAPTVLRWFGVEPTPDMQGHDLADVLLVDEEVREAALFGIHGAHVNVTDGRYVYMRASTEQANAPLEDFTLMPTHMKSRFGVAELADWQPAAPFAFTKGLRTMRVPASGMWMNPWQYGTLLFDLVDDPEQNTPIVDDEVELRMLRLLRAEMLRNDAPDSQFERLGIPRDGELGEEHLLVREQRERAIASAEPLPPTSELNAIDLLSCPIPELLQLAGPRDILAESAPGLVQSEQLSMAAGMSLLDLARLGVIPAGMLRRLDQALARSATPVTASTH